MLRAERLGKAEHSPRHFLRNSCYPSPLSSIHAASPKHWTFREFTCRTRQELRRPARQGLVRWHCLTAPLSGTAPSPAEKRFACSFTSLRLTLAYIGFASSNSTSSTRSSYLLERTWFLKNTGPGLDSHAGSDFPFGDRQLKRKTVRAG